MTDPLANEPIVVTVDVPRVEGVIPLTDLIRRLEENAAARAGGQGIQAAGPQAAEVVARFDRVRRLAAELAAELAQLPDEEMSPG